MPVPTNERGASRRHYATAVSNYLFFEIVFVKICN